MTPEATLPHPFLEKVGDRARTRLLAAAKLFRAAADEYLVREGEPAGAFYLVQSGHVGIGTNLGKRGAVPIQTVGPGEVVGWSWLLPPYLWEFDGRALDQVQGLRLDGEWLRAQCEQDHEFGYQVLKQLLGVIGSRLSACRVQRLDIYR